MQTYYDVLRVSEDATLPEIQQGYRQRIKAVHPDLHQPSSDQQAITVNWAYAVLADPHQRELYDHSLSLGHYHCQTSRTSLPWRQWTVMALWVFAMGLTFAFLAIPASRLVAQVAIPLLP